jgi:hypothetical protein
MMSDSRAGDLKFSKYDAWFSRESGEGRAINNTLLKGLILAQNERWRHGLGMQVVRTQQWEAA